MNPAGTNQHRILYHLGDRCEVIPDIAASLGLGNIQVGRAASDLIARGYLERVERGCFQLTPAGAEAVRNGVVLSPGGKGPTTGVRKPVRNTMRQRLWKAMRILGEFTVPDLACIVGSDRPEALYNSIQCYLRQLASSGYVARSAKRKAGTALSSNGFLRYRLRRDTGPLAPVYSQKRQSFHDFNTGEDVACSPR